jgi:C4-dicarboxylate transporter DctM subunit
MYGGVFTPTEAAGVGAGGAFLFALARGTLRSGGTFDVLVESARTTTMMFSILIGALLFGTYINYTGMPEELRDFVSSFGTSPLMVILAITVIYLVLGCVLESISMILLTVPVFFPLIVYLGYDPVWFGIFVVCVVEISLITPPVGLNVYVLKAVLPDVSLRTIFRGVTPFVVADLFRVALLIAFPSIALVLPKLLFN